MTLSRIVALVAFLMLTGMSRADSHFVISLNDDSSHCNATNVETCNGTDGGGWTAGNNFHVFNFNTPVPENLFPSGTQFECVEGECSLLILEFLGPEEDPNMHIDLGGLSQQITGPFDFQADANGGGAFDFVNATGVHINSLEVDTILDTSNFTGTLSFTCGGTAFANCGFLFGASDLPVETFFFGDPGIDPVAEPGSALLLATASGAIFLGRRALRRA